MKICMYVDVQSFLHNAIQLSICKYKIAVDTGRVLKLDLYLQNAITIFVYFIEQNHNK